ncbi:ESX secretion-associated protein EspG [Nocardia sp. CDC159]|uniref:ESX secretion-associated protein EspG n=1 Tax=Nocardia pulmonis TaxID=2951408 RepID=A0A9X2IZJ4_9NOCA|nr:MULTISPECIES: ESX secretion-associated protein EspG [Nocardia]MCM6776095.1 ESX secretion-associated protein EspG [Nocardia pulmonis]MCM6788578.1 ESX secretion-associated protein EspG [Nocardia sp. CDC159]
MATLTNEGLFAVAERLRVQTLPLVLAVAPRHDSFSEWARAQEAAVAQLTESGVFDSYGEVEPDLALAMYALAQPDRELVARIFVRPKDSEEGATRSVRVCLVRRGEQHAVAVRTDDTFVIQPIWCDGSGTALARPMLAALGTCAPAEVESCTALADELSRRLDAATTTGDYADALYALGVSGRDATTLGLAFESCYAYAEIVAYAHGDGIATRSPGAVAVYDTGRGRLVAAPGIAPDQRIWSTVTPGTDHRIAQAISALIETLPGERWLQP